MNESRGQVKRKQGAGHFGGEIDFVNSCDVSYKFAGMERDDENSANLDYALNRYYNFRMGRFMQADPHNSGAAASDPQSWNAYSYVGNNPLSYSDPDGDDRHVCDNQGKHCQDFTEDQWKLYLRTLQASPNAQNYSVSASGQITYTNENGSVSLLGTATWFDGDAARRANVAVGMLNTFVVTQAAEAVLGVGFAYLGRAASWFHNLPQVRINSFTGKVVGENVAEAMLRLKGYRIVARQVVAQTTKGRRVVDFIVEKGGEYTAIEVKTGSGARNAEQLAKDAAMETSGAALGPSGKELGGQVIKLKTVELRPF